MSNAQQPASAPTTLPFVYVAIQRTGSAQLHAGLFCGYPGKGTCHVLHHPWHHAPLQEDAAWQRYSWVENDWDPLVVLNILARCEAVSRSNPSLPYSLVYDATTHFDANGVLVKTGAAQVRPGLTCATFVLAILNGVGVDILDESRWPPSDSDQPWADKILGMLQKIDPSYVKFMRQQMAGWSRFSPEDVAAASGLPQPPLPDRKAVTPHGQRIAQQL
jgi:hypothetical protein